MALVNLPAWLKIGPKIKNETPPGSFGELPKKDQDIIMQLVGQFVDRSRKDMKTWRDALTLADDPDNPRWDMLQDLYEYLRPDGHLGSVWETVRKGSTISCPFIVRDRVTKQEIPEKTELLRAEWFQNLRGDILDSQLYAYQLIQFRGWKTELGITFPWFEIIPRRNIVPQKAVVYLELGQEKVVDFNDPYFDYVLIWVEAQYKWGIMNDLITSLIYKKNAEESWAEFAEKFGMPLVTAVTNKRDKKEIDRIQAMLEKLGEAAKAVLPEGTTITVHDQQGNTDPYKVYDMRIARSEGTISKRVLGGTMVTDNGSSRSQSEVHERTLSKIVGELDKRLIEFTVNNQVLPILANWGMPFTPNDEFVYERVEDLSLLDQWKIVKEASVLFEIDLDWIAEKFRIPITGIKQGTLPTSLNGDGNGNENFNTPSTATATAAEGHAFRWPAYKGLSCCRQHDVYAAGEELPILRRLSRLILERLFRGDDVSYEATQKAIIEGGLFRDGLFDSWGSRRNNITYDATDHRALAAMEQNLFHFSMVKQKAGVLALNDLLIDKENQHVRTFEEFEQLATPLLENMDRNWLRAEYNFAIATGQNASRYHQFLSEASTVTRFVQYQTVGDSQVRASHQALNGKVFSIDDPDARRLWPPNDWGCRCEFLQYLGDTTGLLTTGKDGINLIGWNEKQEQLFGINRGDIGQVFTANQQYLRETGIAKDIRSLTFDKYGQKKWADIKGDYAPIAIDGTITGKNVRELFQQEPGKDFMGYTDYLGRKMILKEKTFAGLIDEKYSGKNKRYQLFPHIKEVLMNPDEVYLTDYSQGRFQNRYVKFYGDTVLVIPVELGKEAQEITSWYEMTTNDKEVRNGLLIHKQS